MQSLRFDYFDAPSCPTCGSRMMTARRQLHPRLGSEFELVTYECVGCGNKQVREVGPGGDKSG
jgi:DNA-directed RNA polymerase subunit RPC12/RpoP